MYDSRLAIPLRVGMTHLQPQVTFQSHCMDLREHLWSLIGVVAYREQVRYRTAHKVLPQHHTLEFLCLKHSIRSS